MIVCLVEEGNRSPAVERWIPYTSSVFKGASFTGSNCKFEYSKVFTVFNIFPHNLKYLIRLITFKGIFIRSKSRIFLLFLDRLKY